MPQTMTERDQFVQAFSRESAITLKLLKAYPADQGELRPHPKLRPARELAWVFVTEQAIAGMALGGKLDFSQASPPAPARFEDVVTAFENACRQLTTTVSNASDEAMNRTVQFPVGPGKLGDLRAADVLWATVQDQIHHRGQFSIYLRIADGKVPSIYGPTADEPWM